MAGVGQEGFIEGKHPELELPQWSNEYLTPFEEYLSGSSVDLGDRSLAEIVHNREVIDGMFKVKAVEKEMASAEIAKKVRLKKRYIPASTIFDPDASEKLSQGDKKVMLELPESDGAGEAGSSLKVFIYDNKGGKVRQKDYNRLKILEVRSSYLKLVHDQGLYIRYNPKK